jgi:hypothetical protein
MESDEVLDVELEELVDGLRHRFLAWCLWDIFLRFTCAGLTWLTGTGFSATLVTTDKFAPVEPAVPSTGGGVIDATDDKDGDL